MKIAIVCDWLVVYGGAERVLAEILRCFPAADLYAVNDFLPEGERSFLQGKKVNTTFVQHLPFAKKYYRHYLPLMPVAIEQLDLRGYDLVISSSHAVAKGVITGPDQCHVSYVHSPMRYAWDLQGQYLRESGLTRGLKGALARWMLYRMRAWDLRSATRPDYLIANSAYIARRIAKAWRRSATVIYPPVETERFAGNVVKEDFYVTASRLVPYKKVDLIVESFVGMPHRKLVVIGDGPDAEKIRRKAGPNVELTGHLPTDDVVRYLQRAKGFVFAAEEDFGIVPLEAQAAGTPVIAFGRGGALETVRGLDGEHPTGVFFAEQSVKSLSQAVDRCEAEYARFAADTFASHVAQFSPERFRESFRQFVLSRMSAQTEGAAAL